jgi:hypothetical protein
VAVLEELAGDRTAHAAGSGDGDAHQWPLSGAVVGPLAEHRLDRVGLVVAHHGVHDVAVLQDGVGPGQQAFAEPGQEGDPAAGLLLDAAHPLADPRRVDRHLGQPDGAAGVAPLRLGAVRHQPAHHLVGRPADGGDGGDAEPLVDLGTSRVVDPGHHVVDAEGLAGHPGGQDVGVVAAADGGERLRLLDPGLAQGVPVEADAGDPATGERGTQPPERRLVRVDHRHRVPLALQDQRQSRPHPAAAHDDEVHPRSSPVTGSPGLTLAQYARAGVPVPARAAQALASGDVPQITDAFKRLLLGRAMRSDRLHETLLPKRVALPVFASDALSSVAYAPDEVFLTLGDRRLRGVLLLLEGRHRRRVVMLVVVASYRQNVHAYPSGGGDYEVATVNLGATPG